MGASHPEVPHAQTDMESDVDVDIQIEPCSFVQLNLQSIKQGLRQLGSLSPEQQQLISEVTHEQVVSCEGAQNALVRLYGMHQSGDHSRRTLERLRRINAQYGEVRQVLDMPPCDEPDAIWTAYGEVSPLRRLSQCSQASSVDSRPCRSWTSRSELGTESPSRRPSLRPSQSSERSPTSAYQPGAGMPSGRPSFSLPAC